MSRHMPSPATVLPAVIAPPEIRYIKLGLGGKWWAACRDNDELQFGALTDPIAHCLNGEWEAARQHMIDVVGRTAAPATNSVREFRDFFTLPAGTLWITFAEGHLWWTQSQDEIIDRRGQAGDHGEAARRVAPWRNTNIMGAPLRIDTLSTKLTKVAAYQRTICNVADADYLLRKINGVEEPTAALARTAMAQSIEVAQTMIAQLHERDFELLADLLLMHLGWTRVSALGGSMPDVDLIVEQPATRERAFVQVKSRAGQPVLDRYLDIYASSGLDRMFFICHSPQGQLTGGSRDKVHIWTGLDLAENAIRAGLFSWLVERSS